MFMEKATHTHTIDRLLIIIFLFWLCKLIIDFFSVVDQRHLRIFIPHLVCLFRILSICRFSVLGNLLYSAVIPQSSLEMRNLNLCRWKCIFLRTKLYLVILITRYFNGTAINRICIRAYTRKRTTICSANL